MVGLAKWLVGTPRAAPDPAVVAEIHAIRRDLDKLTLQATATGNVLKERIKTLAPSHAREVLLASVLRLLQNLEAEMEERGRALGRCAR
jgi:hypothetical protein